MNRNSKLRDRIRDATNEAILAAAEIVFAEEGLHTAKVESIAARAGVSVGTIYNHLGDRDSVLNALIIERKAEMLEQLDRALQDGEGRPFEVQLEAFFRAMVVHFEAHGKFFYILMQGEFRHLKCDKTVQTQETVIAMFDRLEELMKRGLSTGVLRPELADFYPSFLMGIVRATFMRDRLLNREPVSLQPRIKDFVHFFLRGGGANNG